MSLYPEDGRRRGRSRSTSRDRRPRDEPEREAPSYADVREPSYVYPEDDLDDGYQPRRRRDAPSGGGLPYPGEEGMDGMMPGDPGYYDAPRGSYRKESPPTEKSYRSSRDSQLPGTFPEDDRRRRDDRPPRDDRPRDDERPRRDDDKHRRDDDRPRRDDDRYRRDEDTDRRSRYEEPEDRRSGKSRRGDDEEPPSRTRPSEPPQDKYGRRELDEDKLKHLPLKYSRPFDDVADSPRSPRGSKTDVSGRDDDPLKYLPQKYSRRYDEDDGRGSDRDSNRRDSRLSKKERLEEDLAYGKPSSHPPKDEPATYGSYIPPSPIDERRPSKYAPRDDDPPRRKPASPPDEYGSSKYGRDSYGEDPKGSRPDVLTVEPGARDRDRRRDKSPGPGGLAPEREGRERDRSRDRRRDKSPGPAALTVEPGDRERDRSRDRRGSTRDRSPQPPIARMSSLMVGAPVAAGAMTLAAAPGSPLLESYHGTYQACSPMPSPLLLTSGGPGGDIEPMSPLASGDEGDGGKKRSRRARFHDPEDIASQLARALKGEGPPDTRPLIEILPPLTHDQVMELRSEYKRLVKTGSARKGVNVAKHIRARLKDEDPSLMKACYSVALGQWEAEAYWANFWYQGDKTRRELLIESLMGRTNDEIRKIKDAFTDKKYDNSLTKCMKQELREDKFKKAVLMVLEERRMEDRDPAGRTLPLDYKLVDQDTDDLHKAVRAEKGGESLMISIVVQRSDSHLRAVLKEYERAFRSNFARDALKKSGNLVGELLAHILNGVINRPVRDALLLHHAISASRKDELRRELLISRLVRFHWDAGHMSAVRKAYRERYGRELQEAVRDATSGEWGMFCREMCIARAPNDVRRFDKVEIINR